MTVQCEFQNHRRRQKNGADDFQRSFTHSYYRLWLGKSRRREMSKSFQNIWRCQNQAKGRTGRRVLSDVVKGYFPVLIESGRSPQQVMKSFLQCNKIVQFLTQGKSQSKKHIKYRGLGVVVIKLSSKFKDLSI